LPPPVRADFINAFPWRAELGAWEPTFTERLPAHLRVPRPYRLVDLDPDRVAIWMEDIDADQNPWPPSRFARAAELPGELAADRSDPTLWADSNLPPNYGLHRYVDGPARTAIRTITDDTTLRHPVLTAHADLQTDLLDLAARIPALLDLADKTRSHFPTATPARSRHRHRLPNAPRDRIRPRPTPRWTGPRQPTPGHRTASHRR
jgi:hypothetical protein